MCRLRVQGHTETVCALQLEGVKQIDVWSLLCLSGVVVFHIGTSSQILFKEAFKYLMEFLELIKVLWLQGQETEKSSNSSLGGMVLSWGHIQSHDSVPILPLFSLGMNYSSVLCSILYKA